MSNSKNILSDLDFEKHISELSDRGLIEFVARQQYDMAKLCPIHDKDIKSLQNKNNKMLGAVGGIGALIGGAITGTLDYFLRR